MRSRIFLGLLFGAIGGFLGFLLQEFMVPHLPPPLTNTRQDFAKLGILVGSMIGLGIGVVEGVAVGSPRLLVRGAIVGLLIGAVGGLFGIYAGGIVYNALLFGKDETQLGGNILDFTQQVIARAFGWTFLGAFPGLAAGAATLSRRRAMHGLVGGLLGGFVGGFLFDLVGSLVTVPIQGTAIAATSGTVRFESGGPSRAIGITLIGLFTGLFIGLVEEYMKQAWVRVLAGAKEGKDYIISNPITVLGRDERADVPLFGDPSLAPQQAAVKRENGRHFLLDGGTPLGSVVNGQRVDPQQPQLLRDGDMIQLGQVRLLFREKATATKIGRPVSDAPKSAQAGGSLAMPSHLCPFCGAAKDAQGNCLCTVPGASPGAQMPGPSAFPPPPDAGFDVGGPAPAYSTAPVYGAQPTYGGYGAPGMNGRGSVLAALDGPYAGQTFPLAPGGVSIGRSPDNGIPMTSDVTISRHHAHITDESGQHVLYDDGSSNGTFVNNVRVTVQALVPGDIVQFGASRYRYE